MIIPRNNLQFRLSVTLGLVSAVSLLLGGVLIYQILFHSLQISIQQQLQTASSTLLTLGISDFSRLKSFRELDEFIEDALAMEKAGKVIRIFDPRGRLAFSSMGLDYDELPQYLNPRLATPTFSTVQGKNRRYEALTVPYMGRGRSRSYYLQMVMPVPRFSQIFQTFWWQTLLWFGALLVISVFVSRWLSGILLRPVQVMAKHIAEWDPHHPENWRPLPLDIKGAYLGDIQIGVNDMAHRTQEVIDKIKKISRFIAHEMRTPLTIIQGETETLLMKKHPSSQEYEAVLQSAQEEVLRLSRTIDTILKLGETSGNLRNLQWSRGEMGAWIEESLGLWQRYLTQERSILFKRGAPFLIKTDWELLFQLVDNLIRNIQKHTPPGTQCTIKAQQKNNSPVLVIEDNGPGMSKEFSNSTGLGLYLTQAIAEMIGARLEIGPSDSGGVLVALYFSQ